MDNQKISLATRKALATINAPLPVHIGEEALVACLTGDVEDGPWATHMRSFFEDVHTDTMLDLVIEGTVTWDQLRSAFERHGQEDDEIGRWIDEMAPVELV